MISDIHVVDDALRPGVKVYASVSRDVSELNALERAESRRRQLFGFAAALAQRALAKGRDELFALRRRLRAVIGIAVAEQRALHAKQRGDRDWTAFLLGSPELASLLAPEGLFILESFAKGGQVLPSGAPWRAVDERRYGDSLLVFYQLSSADAPAPDPAAV